MTRRLILGLGIVGIVTAMAVGSLMWTPDLATHMHFAARLHPPLATAAGLPRSFGLLGTDNFGRDVLSEIMVGAWTSLAVAIPAVALGGTVGTALGIASAGRGGLIEASAMRLCDVVFAVPPILSALILATLAGPGRLTAVAAIALFLVPVFARVARGGALPVWASDYVSAARASGKTWAGIARTNVLPNIAGLLAVQASIQLGLAILTEAGLSFLGLGAPPPTPSWGRMLAEAQTFLATAPWLAVAPGAAVAFAVLGFNLLGDGLRDLLDRRGTTSL